MREEILAAIDKIEDEYLIDDNYVRYPDTVHEFQTAADKLMTIRKGCDASPVLLPHSSYYLPKLVLPAKML